MTRKTTQLRPRQPSATPAASAILDVAEQLVQTRGYNGFSYADVAAQLGVTKASLHYHFASKAVLGRALIERYRTIFDASLARIEQRSALAGARLQHYVELYRAVLCDERICLCGMLAAEHTTLPLPMRQSLTLFFDTNERWLTSVLKAGVRSGALHLRDSANARARLLLGALEGAMLLARSYGQPARFTAAAAQLLADLGASSRPGARRRPTVPARAT